MRIDEPVPGYPKREVPRDEDAAKALKTRSLTNLYNTEHKPILIDGTTPDWEIVGVVVGAMIGARPTTGC